MWCRFRLFRRASSSTFSNLRLRKERIAAVIPALSDALYIQFRDLIRDRCGLSYPDRKRDDLAHALGSAAQRAGYQNLELLYADAVNGGTAWELLVTSLTIGETYFFRNTPQFAALRQHIVPDIISRRGESRALRCWSAGCATGEEPYSIAMLLTDLLPQHDIWQASILATDINADFLARARGGLYGDWSFREMSAEQRNRFFTPEGGRWRLHADIRRMVHFTQLNLIDIIYPSILNGTTAMDLILCRNVTIYFDEATTRQVVQRMYDALTPGGWLVVGHAEPQTSIYQQFEVHNFPDTIIYRKPLQAALFVSSTRARADASCSPAPMAARSMPMLTAAPSMPVPKQHVAVEPVDNRHAASTAGHDVEALLRKARTHLDNGAWQEAEAACQVVLAEQPLCVRAHYFLALAYEHQEQLAHALASYRRAVFLDRTWISGQIGMARIWQRMGQANNARRAYQSVVRQITEQPLLAHAHDADEMTTAELLAFATHQLTALSRVTNGAGSHS
jgi:chemotaxis protein methyltransferase CheR